jgi:hypothetical protein
VGKPDGNNHLEDPDLDGGNVKMDPQDVGCEVMDWVDLA